ncbi:MAG: response regulator [Ignavibacteriaceae bacterium]
MKYNIMFVDDAISVLLSLKWMFEDEPYHVFLSNSPLNALNVTKTLEWAVVVVDQSIQNMDCLEFLKRFQAQSPYTMGIIMTGYNEIKETLDTLNHGCVCRFVKKSLDNNEIKQVVKTAIADYETNTRIKRHDIV